MDCCCCLISLICEKTLNTKEERHLDNLVGKLVLGLCGQVDSGTVWAS